jgi:electron transport complex protein RnfB
MVLADIYQLWDSAWPAGVTMLGLGSGFAVVLLIASEKLKVKVDPKVEQVREVLPNLDCGACGFAGCSQYAKAVIANPGDLLGKCAPGGPKTANKIADILNLQISESGPQRRPVVRCRAKTEDKTFYATYQGIQTCISANALANVQACNFGCLGFGDCVRACKFDALHIVNGLAVVDYEKCTGCGACSKSCPRNLIEMIPFSQENMIVIACRSKEAGKVARTMCKVGCIGCGICAKQSEMFIVKDNLAHVDYDKYQINENTETAMQKCPTGVIVYRGKSAPVEKQPARKSST